MPSNASAQLHAIAGALKARGAKGMKRELTVGLRLGAQPLVSAVRAQASARLPHGGGLAARVAADRITVSVTTSARSAGVRLKTSTLETRETDSGYVRHPTFGRPNSWVRQDIPRAAGWWSETLRQGSPAVTPALLAVMEKIAAEIRAV